MYTHVPGTGIRHASIGARQAIFLRVRVLTEQSNLAPDDARASVLVFRAVHEGICSRHTVPINRNLFTNIFGIQYKILVNKAISSTKRSIRLRKKKLIL